MLKLEILLESDFYQKYTFIHYISIGTFGAFAAHMEDDLRQLIEI